jgi:putative ABC transport system permease protein
MRYGGTLTAIGVTIGALGAFLLVRAIEGSFFGLFTADLRLAGGIVAVLVGVALVAMLLPAWRAARLDPAAVLRE